MQITCEMPKIHEPVFEPGARIFYARGEGRWCEAVAAAALQWALENSGKECVIIAARTGRVFRAFDEWSAACRESKTRINGFPIWRFANGSAVWIAKGDAELTELPSRNVGRTFVVDAHLIEQRPSVVCETTTVAGELPDRGHWSFGERGYRVPWSEIVAVYPDQTPELDSDDPFYSRVMNCEDIVPDFSGGDIESFCRERLFVRTDKPPELLTDLQQDAARDQLRQRMRILPLDPTGLQTWYLEEKERILDEKGGKRYLIVVKSRRGGITTLEQAISYRLSTTVPHSAVSALADTWAKSKKTFEMVDLMSKRDPKGPRKVSDSRTAIEWDNGSSFYIGTAGTDAFSRGEGLSRFHGSEADYWLKGNVDRMDSLWSGIAEATQFGDVVLETTPNGRRWIYRQIQEIKTGDSEFGFLFIPWFRDPLNTLLPGEFNPEEICETLTPEEEELVQRYKLTPGQIAFHRQKKRTHKRLMPQEFPSDDASCFLTSGTTFFDMATILGLQTSVLDTPGKATPGGVEHIWKKPEKDCTYVIGCDTSEGIPGGDPNGVGVMNKDTKEQVASVHGLFKPQVLAEHCSRLSKMYNGAMIGVERNNHGHTVLLALHNLGHRRPHYRGGEGAIYYYKVAKTIKEGRAGWDTNAQSRSILLDHLSELIDAKPETVRDRKFVDELPDFCLQATGKWEHNDGSHDDSVFKWGIALQMANLRKVTPRIVMAK